MEYQGQADKQLLADFEIPIEVSLSRSAYFQDHKVAGTCVVPGSALISEILFSEFLPSGFTLSDIQFHHMIPLSRDRSSTLKLKCSGGKLEYVDTATSTIHMSAQCRSHIVSAKKITNFKDSLDRFVKGSDLYTRLDRQGNNYGPGFRAIQTVKFNTDGGEAEWIVPEPDTTRQALTVLIDNLSHVVAAIAGVSSVYYLRSIGSLHLLAGAEIPEEATIECTLDSESSDSHTASFVVRNTAGDSLLVVSELTIAVSEAAEGVETIALAGTFTLDPMLEVFNMWSKRLSIDIKPRFADYGQVFQALHQAGNTFDEASGSRTCFIRLEDWTGSGRRKNTLQADEAARVFSGLRQYELPDGRTIAHLNQYETDYLYREIFIDHSYKRHGIVIQDQDVVIDIGANIGLCTLFLSEEAEGVKVFSVEPSPAVLPVLRANVAAYVPDAVVVAAGASCSRGEAVFSAYKNSSVFSSFAADSKDDQEAIAMIIRNTLIANGQDDEYLIEQAVEEMMNERMDSEEFVCPLISVSDIIEQHQIEKVGLLKIDAEKSENDIITGIREEHWPLIEQLIIEVHKQSGGEATDILALLGEKGFECVEDEETLLSDSGLVTVYAVRTERARSNMAQLPQTALTETAKLFISAAETFQQKQFRSMDIVLCPSTTRDPALSRVIESVEKSIIEYFSENDLINVQQWIDYCEKYPVQDFTDESGNQIGHIPYTRSWYAATVTALVRKHLSSRRVPCKVVVLDCDNTLWKGIAGEAGVEGVRFEKGHIALQHFVKMQANAGKLVCLASKNDQALVKAVFDTHVSEMAIGWDDIVAHRINWERKSENLISLASELNLGLDSFIFLDDSPVECAEVRSSLPQVLTLQIPENSEDIASFLDHVWAFDNAALTPEDKARAGSYQQEKKRKGLLSSTSSVSEFIEKLDLAYSIREVGEEQLARSSQMTMRTNQFNLSTVRRTKGEIRQLIDSGWTCEYISVADRFGDYGITGLAIYCIREKVLKVDTFLLSCRVLGRGIEHSFARHIGARAAEHGCDIVSFNYAKTARNEPALNFLGQLAADLNLLSKPAGSLIVGARDLSALEYNPDSSTGSRHKFEKTLQVENLAPAPFDITQLIAMEFRDADEIGRIAASRVRMPRPALEQEFIAPGTELESNIAQIWCELLGLSEVGVEDDFFKLGGTSLKGVELITRVNSELNAGVAIVALFEKATIAHMAQIIKSGGPVSSAASAGKARGAARRRARLKHRSAAKA